MECDDITAPDRFVADSPLEETVRSEPVSDVTPSGDGF